MSEPPSLILTRSHGWQLDHIGLGVSETEAGARWFEAETGAKVHLRDPEPGQYYWSGSVPLGLDSFLEIIGPNPEYKRFQPFAALLAALDRPTLMFWYVAVDDFDALVAQAKAKRVPIERIEAINADAADRARAGYRRGLMGPGFLSQRPNVIQWTYRPERLEDVPQCHLVDFQMYHPKADRINASFSALGVLPMVQPGRSSVSLRLNTPKGEWHIENPGTELAGMSALLSVAGLWLGRR